MENDVCTSNQLTFVGGKKMEAPDSQRGGELGVALSNGMAEVCFALALVL